MPTPKEAARDRGRARAVVGGNPQPLQARRHRQPNAALNLALTRNVLLALIPFEEGEPLAQFFERYHRHPPHALRLILEARPVL